MLPSKEISEDIISSPSSPPILSPYSTTTKFFQNPTAYPPKLHSKKQPNLHHCYFTPLTHLLLDIISSYTLTLAPLEILRDSIDVSPGSIPKGFLYSHHVLTPGLNPIKTPTEYPCTVLPTQLYASVYFLRSSTPRMTYIPLFYYTSIMDLAHAPTHSLQK